MAKTESEHDVVVWVRLPKAMPVADLKKIGLAGAGCFGGDTCIAASSFQEKAAIVVHGDLKQMLSRAKLVPRDPCYGGNTCIV